MDNIREMGRSFNVKKADPMGKDDSKWGYGEGWDYLDKDAPEEKNVFLEKQVDRICYPMLK